jgi:hypothetical protein
MAEAFDALNLNHHQLRPQLLQQPRGAIGASVAADRSEAAAASAQAQNLASFPKKRLLAAEGLGAAMQVVDDPRPTTGLVGGRARVDVVHPMT